MFTSQRGGGSVLRRVAICATIACTAFAALTVARADPPVYAWSLVGSTPAPTSMHPGQKVVLAIAARNEGTATWTSDAGGTTTPVRLAPVAPRERVSAFASEDPTWLWSGGTRIAMATPVVPPGAVGLFTFTFTAPVLPSYPADFSERFAPVAEGLAWMDEVTATFTTRVRPAASAAPPSPNPPLPDPRPSPPPNPVPTCDPNDPVACVAPSGGSYAWSLVATTPAPASMHPGQKAFMAVVARNDGTATWRSDAVERAHPVRLAAVAPRGRASAFASDDPTWLWSGGTRIAMATPVVEPGRVGLFTFTFTAPVAASYPADFSERFAPVAEDLAWMDANAVTYDVRVRPQLAALPPLPNPSLPNPGPIPPIPTLPCHVPDGCVPPLPDDTCVARTSLTYRDLVPPAAALGYTGSGAPLVGPALRAPRAVAVDALDDLVIADTANDRIVRADTTGNVLFAWGTTGSGNGQLRSPAGVAATATGRIYVADTGNDRIQVFSLGGAWLASFGSTGIAPGSFRSPMGVALVPSGPYAGALAVADSGNDRVQIVGPTGAPLAIIGAGELRAPEAVSVFGADTYVADTGNDRAVRFSDGAVTGVWGGSGTSAGCMRAPRGIVANAYGLFIADSGNDRVERFSRAGPLLEVWGSTGASPGQMRAPAGLAASASDLWVAESAGDRAQRFRPAVSAAPPIPCGSDPMVCVP